MGKASVMGQFGWEEAERQDSEEKCQQDKKRPQSKQQVMMILCW